MANIDYLLMLEPSKYIAHIYQMCLRDTSIYYYLRILEKLIKKYPQECRAIVTSMTLIYKKHDKIKLIPWSYFPPRDINCYLIHYCMTTTVLHSTLMSLFPYVKVFDTYVFLYLIKKNYISYKKLKSIMISLDQCNFHNFIVLGCYFPALINWFNTNLLRRIHSCDYNTMKRIYKYYPHVFNTKIPSRDHLRVWQHYGNLFVTFEQCIHADYDKYVYMGIMNDYTVSNKIDKKIYKYIND